MFNKKNRDVLKNNRGSGLVIALVVILVVLVLAIGGVGAYMYFGIGDEDADETGSRIESLKNEKEDSESDKKTSKKSDKDDDDDSDKKTSKNKKSSKDSDDEDSEEETEKKSSKRSKKSADEDADEEETQNTKSKKTEETTEATTSVQTHGSVSLNLDGNNGNGNSNSNNNNSNGGSVPQPQHNDNYTEDINSVMTSLINSYGNAMCSAINAGNYSIVSPYIETGSALESMQRSLVSNLYSQGITENFEWGVVDNAVLSNGGTTCTLTVRESETVMGTSSGTYTDSFTWTYTAHKQNGVWKLTNLQ
jgi:hypothetical protein